MKSGRKQRHFVPRELRFSVAIITVTSLLAGILMIFLANQISSIMGREISFFIILAAYAALVAFFTLYFAHRFIGPFERLKMELRLFRTGEYSRRLRIRKKDDVYIQSFVNEVNILLQDFKKTVETRKDFIKSVNAGLSNILLMLENEECDKEALRRLLVSFGKSLKEFARE